MHSIPADALPRVILDHVDAYRRQDIDAFLATLAPDALVNDAQREFLGRDAIRAWAAKEIFGAQVTLAIEAAFEQAGAWILRCRVDGTFDKTNLPDPLILSFYFIVRDGRIGLLLIQLNKLNAA